MWHNEGTIGIGTLGLRAMWSRVHNGNLSHCNDVNVEATRTESHGGHATEQPLQLFHANQHFNGSSGRLVWKHGTHLERGVKELGLINESDRGCAIERRDLLNAPARDMREGDDRFGKCRDGIIKVSPDP